MLKQFTDALASKSVNIENMLNKSKGDNAYTMIDIAGNCGSAVVADIEKIDGVIKVTVL